MPSETTGLEIGRIPVYHGGEHLALRTSPADDVNIRRGAMSGGSANRRWLCVCPDEEK